MSFETPESARAELDEIIANIDPTRTYFTALGGRLTGARYREMLEGCTEWKGVKLPPREVKR